jgi:hypothetical protein
MTDRTVAEKLGEALEPPIDGSGENLMFLISQPRSGSTLLQYILGGHPRIHTLPEPWLMLHFVYATRPDGIATEYDARTAHAAFAEFLAALECGNLAYIESVRTAAGHLYGEALRGSEADIFLDKSPRYYFIAEELREIFPRARIVFLIRNPLAVLSSILHTYAGGDWSALRRLDRMHDLVTAPRKIVHAIDILGEDRTAVIQYERLISEPDQVLSELCVRMEIEGTADLKNYVAPTSAFGDSRSTKHNAPVSQYANRWQRDMDSEAKRDVARSYLDELGSGLLLRLGYEYDELMEKLDPTARKRKTGSRWSMLMTPDELLPWWHRMRLGFVHSRHQRGTPKTVARLAYLILRGHAWMPTDPRDHIERRPV